MIEEIDGLKGLIELAGLLRKERVKVERLKVAVDGMLWAHTDNTTTPLQRKANKIARDILFEVGEPKEPMEVRKMVKKLTKPGVG